MSWVWFVQLKVEVWCSPRPACSLPDLSASSKASRIEQILQTLLSLGSVQHWICVQEPGSISCLSSPLGLEEKTVLSKKEKMKLSKERWLQSKYSKAWWYHGYHKAWLCWMFLYMGVGGSVGQCWGRLSASQKPSHLLPSTRGKSRRYCFPVFSTEIESLPQTYFWSSSTSNVSNYIKSLFIQIRHCRVSMFLYLLKLWYRYG